MFCLSVREVSDAITWTGLSFYFFDTVMGCSHLSLEYRHPNGEANRLIFSRLLFAYNELQLRW